MRGLLAERGIVVPCGVARLCCALPTILEEEANNLSAAMREMLAETAERLRMTEERIKRYDTEIVRHCARDERCQRLIAVEGVGPLIATALVAAAGNAHNFRNGRELSAWLGLVPGHHESANREVMLGISKRGDRYLRTLLIHGARAVVKVAERRRDARSAWVSRIKQRARGGTNIAAVALANKNARVLWALLARNDTYRPPAIANAPTTIGMRPQPDKAVASRSARRSAPSPSCVTHLHGSARRDDIPASTAPSPNPSVRGRRGGGKR